MGLFRSLFERLGRPAATQKPVPPSPQMTRGVDWSHYFGEPEGDPFGSLPAYFIPGSPSFLGNGGRISPNRRFAVAWGPPGFVLFKDARICFQRPLPKIVDGDVSDTGSCVLGTASFGEMRSSGRFVAHDALGTLVVEDHFSAAVFNVAISPDARFAVCQTCNGDSRGGFLSVYDIEARTRIRQEENSHWASSYAFDCQEAVLTLRYRDTEDERVALDGSEIPRYRATGTGPTEPGGPADPYDEFWGAEAAFMKLPDSGAVAPEVLSAIRDGFRKALAVGQMSDRKRAEAYRRIGELALLQGDREEAIKAWKSAIAWLPGIGVAKKLKALEHEGRSPSPKE